MGRPKNIGNIFSPVRTVKKHSNVQIGNVGFDNIRENIDPHIKTKVINTKELIVNNEAIFKNSIELESGNPTIIFNDLHIGHDKYRIRVENDLFCFGAGSPITSFMCLDHETEAITLSKLSTAGIKLDTDTPTFGWKDLLGDLVAKNIGASKPTFTTYRDTLQDYKFAAGKEEFFKFHIPHDYVLGSDIFIHVHWSHTSAIITGGTLTFEYEISYSKGHNQATFPASVGTTFIGTASTTQYQQIITEVQISATTPDANQIDSDNLEPDGVILARLKLTSNDITSSGAVPDPFIHYVDIHYQSTNITTKQKTPPFYI